MIITAGMASAGVTSALGRVVEGIPRDPAAILVYLVLGASCVLIWRGSRQKR